MEIPRQDGRHQFCVSVLKIYYPYLTLLLFYFPLHSNLFCYLLYYRLIRDVFGPFIHHLRQISGILNWSLSPP